MPVKKIAPKRGQLSGPTAAFLSWLMPGLGHWWIGEKARGVILFVVITVTFWSGIAVGGVRTVIAPRENGPWIAAQVCMGPQSLIAWKSAENLRLNEAVSAQRVEEGIDSPDALVSYRAPWPSGDIGVVYAGIAGLLNLLVMLDVLARVERMNAGGRV